VEDVLWRVEEVANEQHAVVTWDQLLSAGATRQWVHRREREGYLVRIAPAAYRFTGSKRTWKMRASAAVLSARAPALVSHRSAAWLHGIDEHMPGIIDITVPRHRRPRSRPGVQFHESRVFDMAAETSQVRDWLPVTGVARTILDSCADLPGLPERLDLLDEARRLKLVDWDDLWECLVVHTGKGRPGLKRYRDLLLTRDGTAPAGTKFARRVGLLLESAGLPTPVYEHPVQHADGTYYLDLAYRSPRLVAIECVGRIGHDFERAFEDDPVRRNRLQLLGWIVIEVTWRRFVNAPESVIAECREALLG
jgi:AbiEi antitoxin C-terminal domain